MATIYPPGALIAHLEFHKVDAVFNVSVFEPNNTYLARGAGSQLNYNGFASVITENLGFTGTAQNICNATSVCIYRFVSPKAMKSPLD